MLLVLSFLRCTLWTVPPRGGLFCKIADIVRKRRVRGFGKIAGVARERRVRGFGKITGVARSRSVQEVPQNAGVLGKKVYCEEGRGVATS